MRYIAGLMLRSMITSGSLITFKHNSAWRRGYEWDSCVSSFSNMDQFPIPYYQTFVPEERDGNVEN
jgi:hypothetical protein